ncbi:hypothetical protein ABK040_008933 [Willaertia magna]
MLTCCTTTTRKPKRLPSLNDNSQSSSSTFFSRLSKKKTQCSICLIEKDKSSFKINSKLCDNCHLKNMTICFGCFIHYVKLSIKQNQSNIKCPNCNSFLNNSQLEKLGSNKERQQIKKRMEEITLQEYLANHPNFIKCAHYPCTNGQFVDDPINYPIMKCVKCNQLTCANHKVPFHTGLTCRQYEETVKKKSVENEKLNMIWIKENAKSCPKCRQAIEKIDGCDHIKCISCGYEFCWICLADYKTILERDNSYHKTNCKYYF